ncbi:MAG: DUF493 domain-containing protein [Pirellulaceae bacterium]|nr:DUF493 domain-containing protein [Pirellulaceae bacterium]
MTEDRREESLTLLNNTHEFPCPFLLKIIGISENSFEARVVATVREALGMAVDPEFNMRATPNGEHVSVTLEPVIDSAETVLDVYDRLRNVEGVVMVM